MSCGPDRELLRLMMDDALKQAVKDGTVQGGLKTCDGQNLAANTKMQSCAEAAAEKAAAESALVTAKQDLQKSIDDNQEKTIAALRDAADADTFERNERIREDAAIKAQIASLPDTKPTAIELTRDNRIKLTLNDGVSMQSGALPLDQDTKLVSGTLSGNKMVLTQSDGSTIDISLCDWQPAEPCEYHATLQVNFGGDDCGMFRRVGWAFHPDDLRDPAADTRLTDCNDNTIGWLYPTAGKNHIIDVQDAKGKVLGYALSSPTVRYPRSGCTPCAVAEKTAAAPANTSAPSASLPVDTPPNASNIAAGFVV